MVIPSKVMDRRHLLSFGIPSNSSSSFFSEDLSVPEMQVGFWKSESMVDQKGAKSAFSSPLGNVHHHTVANPAGGLENPGGEAFKSHLDMFSLDNLMGQQKASSLPSISWGGDLTSSSSVDQRFPGYENGLSSSSFSEIFSIKSRSMTSGVLGQSVDTNNSSWGEDEPLGSMEEIEAQTIGDLLPDNDDLISGIINDFEYTGLPTNLDNVDEDIFCTGGGMELENDAFLKTQLSGEQHTSEHPSRALIIKNININIEDSELRVLLQQYGDIQMLYTFCKNRGFVMVSYYDIRAAQKAMRALHNKHLGPRNLDIHFYFSKDNISEKDINQGTLLVSVGSSVSNDDLCQMLSVYGEVKEICKAPTGCNQKLIEFYDVRAVEAAQCGLNKGDISGQKIKLERSSPGGARYCLAEQCSVETKQEECDGFLQQINNSVPGSIGKLAANSQDNGSCHSVYSPVSPLMDESLHGISTGIPQKLSSPISIESLRQHSNQAGHGELSGSLGQGSFGRGMHAFHPHSLPEFYNSMCNKSNSMSPNGMNVNFKLAEGGDYSRTHKAGTCGLHGHSFDQNEAFGVSGIGSCPLHGQHYAWNNSNAFPQSPSAPMLWSNLRHPIHMHGYPGIPPQMLNTSVLPIEQHQLGLASAHGGSFADIHSFHPGSLGSIGFPGSPRLYPSDIAVFPPRGNYREAMFSPVIAGFPSPQQRCHAINGRNPMINVSPSYDIPNDWLRSRRHDGNAAQSDNKKQFELDIDCIASSEDSRTTLMIKNIPNKYTCKMLLAVIDENHRGTYDFIYLPIDFKNKCNVGYAFINMTDPQHIISFFKTFNGKKWEKFNSEKVASLAYARIQGRSALIAHFQNSSLMNEDKWCRPMLFHKDGPNAGDQEPFPVGNNVRPRSGRNRPLTNSDAKQVSPSTSLNEENSSSRANSPSCSTEEPTE